MGKKSKYKQMLSKNMALSKYERKEMEKKMKEYYRRLRILAK